MVWIELALGVMALVVIVTSVVEWPGQYNKERIEAIAVLGVGCETLIDSVNDAINRLVLLVDDNPDVDTAVAELIWARDYVIRQTLPYDLKLKNHGFTTVPETGSWNSGSMGVDFVSAYPEIPEGYEIGSSWKLNQNRKHDAGYTAEDMKQADICACGDPTYPSTVHSPAHCTTMPLLPCAVCGSHPVAIFTDGKREFRTACGH